MLCTGVHIPGNRKDRNGGRTWRCPLELRHKLSTREGNPDTATPVRTAFIVVLQGTDRLRTRRFLLKSS